MFAISHGWKARGIRLDSSFIKMFFSQTSKVVGWNKTLLLRNMELQNVDLASLVGCIVFSVFKYHRLHAILNVLFFLIVMCCRTKLSLQSIDKELGWRKWTWFDIFEEADDLEVDLEAGRWRLDCPDGRNLGLADRGKVVQSRLKNRVDFAGNKIAFLF